LKIIRDPFSGDPGSHSILRGVNVNKRDPSVDDPDEVSWL